LLKRLEIDVSADRVDSSFANALGSATCPCPSFLSLMRLAASGSPRNAGVSARGLEGRGRRDVALNR